MSVLGVMMNAISFGIMIAAARIRYSLSLALMYSLDVSLSSIAAVELSALAKVLRMPIVFASQPQWLAITGQGFAPCLPLIRIS